MFMPKNISFPFLHRKAIQQIASTTSHFSTSESLMLIYLIVFCNWVSMPIMEKCCYEGIPGSEKPNKPKIFSSESTNHTFKQMALIHHFWFTTLDAISLFPKGLGCVESGLWGREKIAMPMSPILLIFIFLFNFLNFNCLKLLF